MATKLSYQKKVCDFKTLSQLESIYKFNNLKHDIKKKIKKINYNKIIEHMTNDKKNNDKRINLILLKKIGQTTLPNSYKLSKQELKKIFNKII